MLLPKIRNDDDYRLVYRRVDTWLPAMREICRRHNLDADQLEFAPPGTHVVFKVRPDRYIKLFAPPWVSDFIPEMLILRKMSEGHQLLVPRMLAEGIMEGWPYIVMTAAEGVPLCNIWDSMNISDKEHIAAQCGEFMASLHSTPTEGLDAIATDWFGFVRNQIRNCMDNISRSDIGRQWGQSVTELFEDISQLFEPSFKLVLLNADITDEHVLVSKISGRWEFTGFIDFGDAMLGHPYYEFAAPGCSITRGLPNLQRAMLLAYGFSDHQLNTTMSRKLLAYTLIHRFINIPALLKMFESRKPENLEELRKMLWLF